MLVIYLNSQGARGLGLSEFLFISEIRQWVGSECITSSQISIYYRRTGWFHFKYLMLSVLFWVGSSFV